MLPGTCFLLLLILRSLALLMLCLAVLKAEMVPHPDGADILESSTFISPLNVTWTRQRLISWQAMLSLWDFL